MKFIVILLSLKSLLGFSQHNWLDISPDVKNYIQSIGENTKESVSKGSVGGGSLINGKLFPFKGKNFMYFDERSYLEGRGFLHSEVRDIVLDTYDSLSSVLPHRYFMIMECSRKNGGRMLPHRTHQNGLSIDFMMPLKKDNKPYYGLDTLGALHYALTFDDAGKYVNDDQVEIDFDIVSRQIVLLNYFAKKNGYRINKVIIKIELKDELYQSAFGDEIKKSGIYVVQGLTPIVNHMHDDHFHIDFEKV